MYRKIMVPLDGSELSECVLTHVQNLAKGCSDTEVVLFRVCEPPVILADYPADLHTEWNDHVRQESAHIQQQCNSYLEETENKLRSAGLKVITKAGMGNPAEEILDYAAQNQVDLIVMATHGRSGVSRWAYGSMAEKVLHASWIPVMVVRPEECKVK